MSIIKTNKEHKEEIVDHKLDLGDQPNEIADYRFWFATTERKLTMRDKVKNWERESWSTTPPCMRVKDWEREGWRGLIDMIVIPIFVNLERNSREEGESEKHERPEMILEFCNFKSLSLESQQNYKMSSKKDFRPVHHFLPVSWYKPVWLIFWLVYSNILLVSA